MRVVLKEYLRILNARETLNPSHPPRIVPNLTELAEAIGVTKPTMSRFANNRIKRLDIDMVEAVILELRARGFNTSLNDILAYDE